MSQQQQPAFMAVPMPSVQPLHWQPPPYHGNDVPARVMMAQEILRDLSFKSMTRGMVNSIGFSEIEGKALSFDELRLQAAACDMLTEYFRGDLRPTQWEAFLIQHSLAHQSPPPFQSPPPATADEEPPPRGRRRRDNSD